MKKHIVNEVAYFRKCEYNRKIDEVRKDKKHRENDIHISEILPNKNNSNLLSDDTNKNESSIFSLDLWGTGDFDRVENEYKYDSSLHWIDLINNKKLHEVIENLSDEEKIFISLIFYEQKTQNEIAELYNVSQPAIFRRIHKIIRKIKNYMFKR